MRDEVLAADLKVCALEGKEQSEHIKIVIEKTADLEYLQAMKKESEDRLAARAGEYKCPHCHEPIGQLRQSEETGTGEKKPVMRQRSVESFRI